MATPTENFPRHTPPQTDVLVQDVLDPRMQNGQLSQKVGVLLAGEDLKRFADEIDPKDQAKLVERVDQVRFQIVFLFLLSSFHTGSV